MTDVNVVMGSGRRAKPPFRADHVGSLLRPRRSCARATTSPPARSMPMSSAGSRTKRYAMSCKQEDVGLRR